jgi:lipopolysaccharide biosynthesis glycosyltransferase
MMSRELYGFFNPVSQESVPIITCFDDNFSIGAAALISSIIQHSSKHKKYDIFILEDHVSSKNKEKLLHISKNHKNITIHFFDVSILSELEGAFTHGHFSVTMYARLFIPILFSKYPKVVYIDSDTVVCGDLAELMAIDLQGNMVGAVRDINMEGFAQYKIRSIEECGRVEAGVYLKDNLNIEDPKKYFYSGMMVLDIFNILKSGKEKELIESIGKFKFWLPDQDILNKIFHTKVKYLPLNWNLLHGNGNTGAFCSLLNSDSRTEYIEARKNPKIIHYAGDQKPWLNKKVDFYSEFSRYITGTVWEKDLVLSLNKSSLRSLFNRRNWPFIVKRIKSDLAPILNIILPMGSDRRVWVSKIYSIITKLVSN